MQQLQQKLQDVHVRAMVIRGWNVAVIVTSCVSLVLLVISWTMSIGFEGGKLKQRHGGSIFAFIACAVTIAVDVASLYLEPSRVVLYSLQVLAVLSLFLNAVSAGMNAIVVDQCAAGEPSAEGIHCFAHDLEYAASIFLCACLVSIYVTTQQKVVVFVDKGILTGMGSRMSRVN